jgi:crotonobetaine/carnitine-CoA ligase
VPINTAYRGGILEHVVRNSGAALMIAAADLAPAPRRHRLLAAAAGRGPGRGEARPEGHGRPRPKALEGEEEPADPARPIEPGDTQSIIYTSGTTGPSKGVLSSYAHLAAMGTSLSASRDGVPFVRRDDRFMVNLPMFHVGGTAPTYAMLVKGGSIALLDSFDTRSFWPTVRETGDNRGDPARRHGDLPDEGTRPARRAGHAAQGGHHHPADGGRDRVPRAFRGDHAHALQHERDLLPAGRGGEPDAGCDLRPAPAGVEIRLVDGDDRDVPPGAIGELILRTEDRWALNHGYNGDPEATERAWRGGWFHTGDAFRVDEAGNYFFVDRFKDAIRRRGENVSSFEVEMEVCAHPAVREAAAVAVPSEFGEDEILVALSLAQGATLDPAELIAFLQPRMAHFMVPRYLRILDDLPKTPTRKVEKYLIRQAGIAPDTWIVSGPASVFGASGSGCEATGPTFVARSERCLMLSSLLIANRGEVSVRIARAAAELGMRSVAVFSRDDSGSPHRGARRCGRRAPGSGPAAYLDIPALVNAALAEGCEAVHPGYGFLSESAAFARACELAGLVFVGPTPDMLDLFGDKGRARRFAEDQGYRSRAGPKVRPTLAEARLSWPRSTAGP